MLPYFRNYVLVAYILAIVVPVGLVTVLSWILGFYLVSTVPGLIFAIVAVIASLLIAKKVVTKLVDRKSDKLISLYNDDCDPAAFLEKARPIVENIRSPYDEAGSWFLSYYALALDDIGKQDEATHIVRAMLSDARAAANPSLKAAILVNIEPLVFHLFGAKRALEVVEEAQEILSEFSNEDSESRLSFLEWEHSVLLALYDNDNESLVRKLKTIRYTNTYPLRMRVNDALLESSAHKAQGDLAQERECLEFIVEKGNKLSAVELAKSRLAEL